MTTVIDGSGGLTANNGAIYNGIQSATAQNSTSGTSIDFTSIPSWVKRITVMFNGVSTNGTSSKQVQIGSGSIITTGYTGSTSSIANNGTPTLAAYTSGFLIDNYAVYYPATADVDGQLVLTLITGNTWVASGVLSNYVFPAQSYVAGKLVLSGSLDRVRITTVNGTDTFDAGSINILYE